MTAANENLRDDRLDLREYLRVLSAVKGNLDTVYAHAR